MSKKSPSSFDTETGVIGFFYVVAGGTLLLLFFVLLLIAPRNTQDQLSFFRQREQERETRAQVLPVRGVKCPDVTGDSAVAANDIFKIRDKFGTYSGQPDYDPNYDINGDGSISASDIQITVQHFGQICSTLTTDVAAPEVAVLTANPAPADSDVRLVAFTGNNCDVSKFGEAVASPVEPNQTSLSTGKLTPSTRHCLQLVKRQDQVRFLRLSDPITIDTPPFANLEWVKTAFPNRFDFRYSNLPTNPNVSMRFGVRGNDCQGPLIYDKPVVPPAGVANFYIISGPGYNSFCSLLYWVGGGFGGDFGVPFSNLVVFKQPVFKPVGNNLSVNMNFTNLLPGASVAIYEATLFGDPGKALAKQVGPGKINAQTSAFGLVLDSSPNSCLSGSIGSTVTLTCQVEFDFTNLAPNDAVAICRDSCDSVWSVIGYGKTFTVQSNFEQRWVGRSIADGARFSPFSTGTSTPVAQPVNNFTNPTNL